MPDEHLTYWTTLNSTRRGRGFLTLTGLIDLLKQGNVVLDPNSTLISEAVSIGQNNLIYPDVIIECRNSGLIRIGSNNVFFPGTLLLADQGEIRIGDFNEFGDGGVSLKANRAASLIEVAHQVRLVRGVQALGQCLFGRGSQVIGSITVQDCVLGPGESYRGEDPNGRGGLLKGFGLARGLNVPTGFVIEGTGIFRQEECIAQSLNHHKQ